MPAICRSSLEKSGKKIRLHNFYVPAGGDEPDRLINPKFGHKLDFIDEMKLLHAESEAGISSILVGDLNIAPLEHDVWSHKQLLKIVSHTPVETEGLDSGAERRCLGRPDAPATRRRRKSSTPGGATAPRIGKVPTKAGVSTMSGHPPTSRRISPASTS